MAFTLSSGGSTVVDMTAVYPGDTVIFGDTIANDNVQDKTFTAPFDFDITGIRIEYAASTAVTTRLIRMEWLLTSAAGDQAGSPGDICLSQQFQNTPIAQDNFLIEVSPNTEFLQAVDSGTYIINGFERCPEMRLRAGHGLRFVAAASNGADDMGVFIRGIATT